MLNAKVSFQIPKEINKSNIEEIFKILQAQKRPELVEEIKNLVLISGKEDFIKEKTIDFLSINKFLPAEMLEKILEWLDIKSLVNARLTCKHWRLIIDNILEKAFSKFSKSNNFKNFAGSKICVPI